MIYLQTSPLKSQEMDKVSHVAEPAKQPAKKPMRCPTTEESMADKNFEIEILEQYFFIKTSCLIIGGCKYGIFFFFFFLRE